MSTPRQPAEQGPAVTPPRHGGPPPGYGGPPPGYGGAPPGYGVPPAGYGGPPPRRSRPALWIALTAVAAIVTLTTVTLAVMAVRDQGSRADRSPSGRAATVQWSVPFDAAPPAGESGGGWVASGVVTRMARDDIRGYDLATGRQRWVLPAPGVPIPNGATPEVCGLSDAVVDGVAAASYGTPRRSINDCDGVAAIEVSTGKVLWKTQLRLTTIGPYERPHGDGVWVTKDTVVVATSDAVVAYARRDGRKLWETALPDRCDGDAAKFDGRGGVVAMTCDSELVVLALGPDGKEKWRYAPPDSPGYIDASVLSVEPAAVSIRGSRPDGRLVTLDGSGSVIATIPVQQDGFALDLSRPLGSQESTSPLRVVGSTLYVPSARPRSLGQSHRLVAIDLRTGKPRWTATENTALRPLRVDGDALVVLVAGDDRTPPRLTWLSLADGTARRALAQPPEVGKDRLGRIFTEEGGRLVVLGSHQGDETAVLVTG